MQALNAGCHGPSFAFTRCCASREKRLRRRRTKEERRSMVEHFIIEYRSKHNGEFPSLNMAHKEVGGNFYTIREIVRDIIQENKVLAPGTANLKLLSLEDSLENHVSDTTHCLNMSLESQLSISSVPFSSEDEQIDISSELEYEVPIASMTEPIENEQIRFPCELNSESLILSETHSVDNKQTEFYQQSYKYDEENFDILTSKQEGSSGQLFSVSKSVESKPYRHLHESSDSGVQHQKLFTSELKEETTSSKSGQTQNSVTNGQTDTEHGGLDICSMDRVGKVEQKSPFLQSISTVSTLKMMVLDDEQTRSNNHTVTSDDTEVYANNMTPNADMFPEMKMSFSPSSSNLSDQVFDGSVTFTKEDLSVELFSSKTSEVHHFNSEDSNESEELSGIDEVTLQIPSEKTSNIDKDEAGAIATSILVDKETESSESPVNQSSEILSSHISQIKAKETEFFSGELFLPNLKEKSKVKPKAEHALGDHKYDGASPISSKLPENCNKEKETGGTNAFLRAIKSFVDSFIKFWME